MKLFAGIDGGQSSTIAVVGDEKGAILGRGVAGPCDEIGQAADSVRFAQALEGAISGALAAASLPLDSSFAAIVAGISGYEGSIVGVAPRLNAERICYLHDARIAHAGAFGGGVGIVVIAGTGSVAFGRNGHGDEATVGGWGFLFGDEGSAFAVARAGLSSAMRAEDGGIQDAIEQRALAFFERKDLREIARAFYLNAIDRTCIAGFATEIFALASSGERCAQALLEDAAGALAELAESCARRLKCDAEPIEIALIGGTFVSRAYKERVEQALAKILPRARVVPVRKEPAAGALELAYKEATR